MKNVFSRSSVMLTLKFIFLRFLLPWCWLEVWLRDKTRSIAQQLKQTVSCRLQEVHSDEIDTDSAYILFYEQQGVDYSQFLPKTEGKKMADTTSMDEDFESDYKKYCVLQWCHALPHQRHWGCQYASAMRSETATSPQRTIICESTKYQLADRHKTAADCAFRIEVPDTSDTRGRDWMSESQRTVACDHVIVAKQTNSQSLDITITRQTKLLFHVPAHTGESRNPEIM